MTKRLSSWNVEGVDDAEAGGKDEHVPDAHLMRERQHREDEGKNHRDRLRRDQNAMPVEPVGDRTADGGKEKDRDLACECGNPEQRR
jgi:hypothetical protein